MASIIEGTIALIAFIIFWVILIIYEVKNKEEDRYGKNKGKNKRYNH